MIKIWVTINNNIFSIEWLSEFLKFVEVVMLILGFVEDECIFSMLAFMKNKLHNKLGPNLDRTI